MSDKELIIALQKQIAELLQRVSLLEARNADLALKNAELTEELVYYKAGRNSCNSHLPPGSDLYKQVSLKHKKKKSSRNPGGQHGHKASRLEKVDVPDVVVVLEVTSCFHCSEDIPLLEGEVIRTAQVFDIPRIELRVTEHYKTYPSDQTHLV